MRKVRLGLGFLVGGLMVLSCFAHSVLGWKAISASLADAETPPDLQAGLGIGWRLGGVAMLAFGLIVIHQLVQRARGIGVSLVPSQIIAATYLVYGIWAFVAGDFQPFFAFLFVIPGVLLGGAVFGFDSDA